MPIDRDAGITSNLSADSSNRVQVTKKNENPDKNPKNKKLKSSTVNDVISRTRTMTGSRPDEININPVQEAAEKTAVMAYGRFNPPTTGHHKLIQAVETQAKKVDGSAHIIASHTEGNTKNPLSKEKKTEYIKAISEPGTHVSHSTSEAPTLLHQAARLGNHAHHLVMVAGSDRVKEYQTLLNKYNGVAGPHGSYNFKSIKVVSAGARDPDAEGTTGISGTKMREHANNGNVEAFKKGLPKELHQHAEDMIRSIQKVKDIEPVKKKKSIKESIFEAFNSETQISDSGLQALKEKSYNNDIDFDSIMEQYTLGYIDNLITDNKTMTAEQAGFASVNSFIANELFEKKMGLWDNIHAKRKRIARGSGEKMRKPGSEGAPTKQDFINSQKEEVVNELSDKLIGRVNTLRRLGSDILKGLPPVPHKTQKAADTLQKAVDKVRIKSKVGAPPMKEDIDSLFVEKFGKEREAIPRSGQARKDIDLVVRKGEDRKTDDRPYRQQAITKQVIEGYIHIGPADGSSPYDKWGDKKAGTITLGNDSKFAKKDKEPRSPVKKNINDRLTTTRKEDVNVAFDSMIEDTTTANLADYKGPMVRTMANRIVKIKKEMSRAVSSKMRKAYPGKSGSSGGGSGGGASGSGDE